MESFRPRLRTWLIAAGALLLLVVAVRVVRSLRPPDPAIVLRDSIAGLRASADSCRIEVDSGAAGMRAYGRTLDSMRARVRGMEALDPRGVPADSYDIYMAAFDAYNDSVEAWPEREDSVRALDARCRDLALHHNALTDSLRALLFRSPQD
ncbi:MAG TPA: hypothetical protein VFZ69_01415 [Longimicrobiales bacterium]